MAQLRMLATKANDGVGHTLTNTPLFPLHIASTLLLFQQPASVRKSLRESARLHQVLHIDGPQRYSPKTGDRSETLRVSENP
jgi:hypothetical protein